MEIRVCKSTELTKSELADIVDGLCECLHTQTTSERLLDYFKRSSEGFCYHSIVVHEGKIVGHTLIYPIKYLVNGKEALFSQSGTTFILAEFRKDIFLYKKMFDQLKAVAKNSGIQAIFAVTNMNSHDYTIKFLKFRELGNLSFFGIPLMGIVYSRFPLLKYPIITLLLPLYLLLSICVVRKSDKIAKRIGLSTNDCFYLNRLSGERYKSIKILDNYFTYTIGNENNFKVIYLMDIKINNTNHLLNWLSKVLFVLMTNYMDCDFILDIGTKPKLFVSYLRVLTYIIPRKLPLSVFSLNSENSDIQIENIDFSILNFDVR